MTSQAQDQFETESDAAVDSGRGSAAVVGQDLLDLLELVGPSPSLGAGADNPTDNDDNNKNDKNAGTPSSSSMAMTKLVNELQPLPHGLKRALTSTPETETLAKASKLEDQLKFHGARSVHPLEFDMCHSITEQFQTGGSNITGIWSPNPNDPLKTRFRSGTELEGYPPDELATVSIVTQFQIPKNSLTKGETQLAINSVENYFQKAAYGLVLFSASHQLQFKAEFKDNPELVVDMLNWKFAHFLEVWGHEVVKADSLLADSVRTVARARSDASLGSHATSHDESESGHSSVADLPADSVTVADLTKHLNTYRTKRNRIEYSMFKASTQGESDPAPAHDLLYQEVS
jgi:hypothetical protein